jgi:hypothetical protein
MFAFFNSDATQCQWRLIQPGHEPGGKSASVCKVRHHGQGQP